MVHKYGQRQTKQTVPGKQPEMPVSFLRSLEYFGKEQWQK